MAIIQNRRLGSAVIRDIANANYQITDFATPNTAQETVTNVSITQIYWTGDWTIKRGTTVVFQTGNNTGFWDLNSHGISLTDNNAANLTINTTSTSATLVLKLSKTSTALTF
jgi:hypothetical protein